MLGRKVKTLPKDNGSLLSGLKCQVGLGLSWNCAPSRRVRTDMNTIGGVGVQLERKKESLLTENLDHRRRDQRVRNSTNEKSWKEWRKSTPNKTLL